MSYVGQTREIPAGEKGLQTDANPADADPLGLLVAEGIDQTDGSNRTEGGAHLFDASALGASATVSASLSASKEWQAVAAKALPSNPLVLPSVVQAASRGFPASYAPKLDVLLDFASSGVVSYGALMLTLEADADAPPVMTDGVIAATAASAFSPSNAKSFTVAQNVPAGDMVVLFLPTRGSRNTSLSVTDSRGNTWIVSHGTGPDLSQANIARSVLTTGLQIGDTITVTRVQGASPSAFVAASAVRIANPGTSVQVQRRDSGATQLISSDKVNVSLTSSEPDVDKALVRLALVTASLISVDSATVQSPGYTAVAAASNSTLQYLPLFRSDTGMRRAYHLDMAGVTPGNHLVVAVSMEADSEASLFANLAQLAVTDRNTPAGLTFELVASATSGSHTIFVFRAVADAATAQLSIGTATGAPIAAPRHAVLLEVAGAASVQEGLGATGSSTSVSVPLQVREANVLALMFGTFPGAATVTPGGGAVIPTNGELSDSKNERRTWVQSSTPTQVDVLVGLHDWHPTTSIQRLISVSGTGSVLRSDDPLTDIDATTIGALTASDLVTFVDGGKETLTASRKLFIFNGEDVPSVLAADGTSLAPIAMPPLDWGAPHTDNRPAAGAINANRLWAFGGKKFPHQVYVSAVDDHEDFTTEPLAYTVRSAVGERIMAAASFAQRIFMFKWPRGIYVFDTSDPDVRNWFPFAVSESLGVAASPFAVVQTDTDVVFLAADGSFHKLSAVDNPDGVQTSDITIALQTRRGLRDLMNLSRLHQVRSSWYPLRKWALFSVPSAGSAVNDLTIKFDFSRPDIAITVSRRDVVDAMTIRRDEGGIERPLIAEGTLVYELDREERTKGGASYLMRYQTPHLDFGSGAVLESSGLRASRKTWDFLELVQRPKPGGTVLVETFLDGSDTPRQSIVFSTDRARQRRRLLGNSRTISLKVTAPNDADIATHVVSFRPSNEAQR